MPKILFLDTYYPKVLDDLPLVYTYKERVQQLNNLMFGTSDFYSHEFNKMGWEAIDFVANDNVGFQLWANERESGKSLHGLVRNYKPDVLYLQDLSIFEPDILRHFKSQWGIKVIASQHSCPWAGDHRVSAFDIVFTSFPHYLDRIAKIGPKSHFLPIAFGGERILEHVGKQTRDIGISFVGGIGGGGIPGHWREGTELLRNVAIEFGSEFKWWGYGRELLSDDDPLAKAYQGPAWGRKMYEIYARSLIVINRHGEVAEGYTNNMRCFEATGMGALLATEKSKNLNLYFNDETECLSYKDSKDLIAKIYGFLMYKHDLQRIAEQGQKRTLMQHTYERRLKSIEPILKEML